MRFNLSLVRWGTPVNCSNHGQVLEHPLDCVKTELKQLPLKEYHFHNGTIEVFKISEGFHLTNEWLNHFIFQQHF